jgi:hypothetical protein
MASRVLTGRKGLKLSSIGCLTRRERMTILVRGSCLCLTDLVKNLQKDLAMSGALVKALPLKEMGWLGGGRVFLPARDFRRDQNLPGSALWLLDSTLSLQAWREEIWMASAMWMFKAGMAVSDGLWALSLSRSAIRSLAEFGRPGTNFFLKPVGMLCLDAVQRTCLKTCSPLAQEVGGGWREKRSSVSRMKPA